MRTDLEEFETVATPAEADAGGETAPADAGSDGSQGGAATDAGAAAEPAAPPPAAATPSIDDLLGTPEAEARISQILEQREQAAALEQQQAEQAQTDQGRWTNVEEALALLGIEPDDFKGYMQAQFGGQLQPTTPDTTNPYMAFYGTPVT
jgi:hypothetical protein